jgi:PST family polysaccharide transporter
MLRFGGFVTGTNALNYLFRNADNALIGWYWGAAPLGLYARAYGLLLLPINQVNAPLGNVAVPALSRLHADPERFRHYFLRGYSLVASLVIPIIVALSLFAEDVVLVVLGPNWHEAVTLFRLLAPAALIGALLNPFGWLFVASGRPDRQFRLAMGWAALIVAAFLAGLGYGPAGVATGYSIMSCLLAIPLCRYAIAGTRLRLLDLFNSVRAPLASALIAGGVGLLLQLKLPAVSAARGFANCSLMLLTYSLVLALGFRQWAYYRGLFQELFPGRFAARLA